MQEHSTNQGKIMHRHEMQQSNIYLGIQIIEYYFFWKNRVLHRVQQEIERLR
jgi:hypothetical protein